MAASKDLERVQNETDQFGVVGVDTQTFLDALNALTGTVSYADDAAAATGGVAVGLPYLNGSLLMVRVA